MKHVVIETIWEPDIDSRFDELTGPGYCFEHEDPDDWQCWQSEVRATAIVDGKFVTGSAYLGGTWEKFGDNPQESNPNISGYYPQMLEEALSELFEQLPSTHPAYEEVGNPRLLSAAQQQSNQKV